MLIVSLTSSCMPPSFPYNFSVRLSELISQAAMPASVTENFFAYKKFQCTQYPLQTTNTDMHLWKIWIYLMLWWIFFFDGLLRNSSGN